MSEKVTPCCECPFRSDVGDHVKASPATAKFMAERVYVKGRDWACHMVPHNSILTEETTRCRGALAVAGLAESTRPLIGTHDEFIGRRARS